MNILIGSDLHGSYKYGKIFLSKIEKYNIEKILLLGDLYYNGARNNPPEEYSPKDLVPLMNAQADKIIVVRGNCDSEVDQMVSTFTFQENATINVLNKTITMSHGHHIGFNNLPENPGDIFIQGHTHISVLERKGNLILLNPGSISLPKDGFHSYAIMNEKGITIYNLLDDSIIKQLDF